MIVRAGTLMPVKVFDSLTNDVPYAYYIQPRSILTPAMMTRETLKHLNIQTNLILYINAQYDQVVGLSLKIRRPAAFQI